MNRLAALWALAVVLGLACAHGRATVPADARVVILSVTGVDSVGDLAAAEQRLRAAPGVYATSVDKRRAEITVWMAPSLDAGRLVAAVEGRAGSAGHAGNDGGGAWEDRAGGSAEGVRATLGPGHGAYRPAPAFPPGADVAVLARDGEDVPDLAPHLAAGKVTVFDFFAPWCGPCRAVDEHMRGVLAARADVAYRKLDVADWDSPLARRWLVRAPALPYLVVYDARGVRVGDLSGFDERALDAVIAKAAVSGGGR